MRKQDLAAKGMAELRAMARAAGIKAGRSWKKEDFIKALSEKKPPAPARKTPVKKRPSAPKPPENKAAVPPVVPPSPLPSEYLEDKVVSLFVTPQRLYVYWEVTEKTLAGQSGNLNLKIISTISGDVFYLPVSERVGEYFVSVSPGYAYVAEIGVIDRTGEFIALVAERRAAPPAPAREKQKEPPPLEWTEPVPRVLSIIFAPSPGAAEEKPLPEAETGRPEDLGPGIPEEYPSGVLQPEGLPGEFFTMPASISSAEEGGFLPEEKDRRERGAGDLPEEFFEMPESISSY